MSKPQVKRRAKRGSVQVKSSNSSLQLAFSYDGKRRYISLGISSTPLNRKTAKDIAFEVQRDIEYGEFDTTYQKYKALAHPVRIDLDAVVSDEVAPLTLSALWSQYVEARKPGKSPTTIRMYGWVANHLERCPHKLAENSQVIFDWFLANVPAGSAKRVMMHLSACCKWAKRSGLIETNPFEGMAAEIKLKKVSNEETEIYPFTKEERDRLITAFETNRYYKHYAPLVKFLFFTGCRPSEALGLTWRNVKDYMIIFDQAVVYDGNSLVIKKGLKTQKSRKFPMNDQLRAVIEAVRVSKSLPDDGLVFPSPKGKLMDWSNFTTRAWKNVMDSVPGIEYRNPYQTRHTFCSLCRGMDIPSVQVAKWVGNSATMIDRVYAKPVDQRQVPEL